MSLFHKVIVTDQPTDRPTTRLLELLWAAKNPVEQGCTILHGVLTISSDFGRFEQYRNGMYPTRPDKIN